MTYANRKNLKTWLDDASFSFFPSVILILMFFWHRFINFHFQLINESMPLNTNRRHLWSRFVSTTCLIASLKFNLQFHFVIVCIIVMSHWKPEKFEREFSQFPFTHANMKSKRKRGKYQTRSIHYFSPFFATLTCNFFSFLRVTRAFQSRVFLIFPPVWMK